MTLEKALDRFGFSLDHSSSALRLVAQAKLKAATAVNVRHILCEKQSKALEALEKIQVNSYSARHAQVHT